MKQDLRVRRFFTVAIVAAGIIYAALQSPDMWQQTAQPAEPVDTVQATAGAELALDVLAQLEVKGRAPSTGYQRAQFGSGWASEQGCDTRNTILYRDLEQVVVGDDCRVQSGVLQDPYTGTEIQFTRAASTSADVQIDHVVALSNAWQTGAQQLAPERRVAFSNDPLNLLAVDGAANQQKGSGDAATWLPPNKPFRCQYVARQIAVKHRYELWVTQPEYNAMQRILSTCSLQVIPAE